MRRKKTTKQIKEEREKLKWDNYNKVNSTNHNPQPVSKMKMTKNSNFINLDRGYFKKGKYKGVMVEDVKLSYLDWVIMNVRLSNNEIIKISKIITKRLSGELTT